MNVLRPAAAVFRFSRIATVGLLRDAVNTARFGPSAPRFAERIYVDVPTDIWAIGNAKRLFGRVATTWPPYSGRGASCFTSSELFLSCKRHWKEGLSWEETGMIERTMNGIAKHGKRDGCLTRGDVLLRYQRLDALFEQAKREQRLRSRQELDALSFREWEGICFHVGPRGEFLFGKIGQHRLAIAILLGFSNVPAMLGAIHKDALPLLPRLRQCQGRPKSSKTD